MPHPQKVKKHASATKTLDHLLPGQSGRVRRVKGSGAIHRRILDMGISKGALIEMKLEAPLRDPIKIKVRGYALSLRRSEARTIEIEQADGNAECGMRNAESRKHKA